MIKHKIFNSIFSTQKHYHHISRCSKHMRAVDSSTSLLASSPVSTDLAGVFSGKIGPITPVELAFGAGGALVELEHTFGAGGAANTGIACLIHTGGATFTGRGCIILGCPVEGAGSGGAEYTGTAVLIVTGGAIPL